MYRRLPPPYTVVANMFPGSLTVTCVWDGVTYATAASGRAAKVLIFENGAPLFASAQQVAQTFTVMPARAATILTVPPDQAARQAGLLYYGLQDGDICLGGNDLAAATSLGPADCTAPCRAELASVCGVAFANSIYRVVRSPSPDVTGEGGMLPDVPPLCEPAFLAHNSHYFFTGGLITSSDAQLRAAARLTDDGAFQPPRQLAPTAWQLTGGPSGGAAAWLGAYSPRTACGWVFRTPPGSVTTLRIRSTSILVVFSQPITVNLATCASAFALQGAFDGMPLSATIPFSACGLAAFTTSVKAAELPSTATSGAALVLHLASGFDTSMIPAAGSNIGVNLIAGQTAVRQGSVLLPAGRTPLQPMPLSLRTLDTAPPYDTVDTSSTPLAAFSGSLSQSEFDEPLLSLHNDFVIFFRTDAANHLAGFIVEYNVTTASAAAAYMSSYQTPATGGAAFNPAAYSADLNSYYAYRNRVEGEPYVEGNATAGCDPTLYYQPPAAADGMWLLNCNAGGQ
ncbi:hypothetical protein HXX76_007851 [Chlamydomonas incerta]|uniref:CUB domain-containing protein n=1 Tax=Chlamydomonas incerta TaxID=51695 RepID=A0A835SVS7_CHLIN|nr:hypothetical protein HXX76_007851 [Chlamydomonas incerta]|eukprot:KAG2434124.1 hypothetical protein HXX76_007851 [Chlamydomonas incerta]